MGRDKASILIRGKPLWEHQLEKLRKVQPEQVFVSARIDPSWRPGDVRFVADTAPSRGPLSGLAASIERMTTSHLLALAVDMPWMSKTYLEFLCAQIEPGCGVVPKIGDRAEPLAAIYPQEANGDFRNALTGADFYFHLMAGHTPVATALFHSNRKPFLQIRRNCAICRLRFALLYEIVPLA